MPQSPHDDRLDDQSDREAALSLGIDGGTYEAVRDLIVRIFASGDAKQSALPERARSAAPLEVSIGFTKDDLGSIEWCLSTTAKYADHRQEMPVEGAWNGPTLRRVIDEANRDLGDATPLNASPRSSSR